MRSLTRAKVKHRAPSLQTIRYNSLVELYKILWLGDRAMKRAFIVLAIIVGLALCGELMGAALFLLQTGGLIYVSREPVTVAASPEPLKNKQRLHPYFGFTGKYSKHFNTQQFYTNSLGLLQREPLKIPVRRGPTDFVVAIFEEHLSNLSRSMRNCWCSNRIGTV
jgi:hypothetical protein